MEPDVLSRAKGAYYAASVGECLGAPIEFMNPLDIRKRFGKKPLTELIGGGFLQWKVGEPTDDIEITHMVARSIIESNTFSPELIGNELVKWYHRGPRGLGSTTAVAVERLVRGVSWDKAGNDKGRGNGSLVRLTPLAIKFYDMNPVEFGKICDTCSCITHSNPEVRWSAVTYGVILQSLLKGYPIEEAIGVGVEIANMLVSDSPVYQLEYCILPSGFSYDILCTSVTTALMSRDIERSLVDLVNIGNDSDTSGACAGSFLGAMYGFDAIPERWTNKLMMSTTKVIESLLVACSKEIAIAA